MTLNTRWVQGPLAALLLLAYPAAWAAQPAAKGGIPPIPDPKVNTAPLIGKFGGRMVIDNFAGGPKTFNALLANETTTTDVIQQLYTQLFNFNNLTQETEMGLAKSCDKSADGLTYTLHLRHARFSDGSPITSADVLFAFQIAYDEKIHPSVAELLKIEGKPWDVSAPDDYTVVVKLPGPTALFMDQIGSLYIMPKAKLEPAFKAGNYENFYGINTKPADLVTSGSWKLKQFVPGEKLVLERNPYYFEADKKGNRLPYMDELVWVYPGDQNGELLKFESGEVDALDDPRPSDFSRLEKGQAQGNYKLTDLGPSLNTNFFWFNLNLKKENKAPYIDPVKYSWFNNPNFRRAVALTVNQPKMVRLAFQGQAAPNYGPMTKGNKLWYDPNVKQYNYDLNRARQLLAKEGFLDRNKDGWLEDSKGNKVAFTLVTNAGNSAREAMGNLIKNDLKAVGIDMTFSPIDFNLMITKIRQTRDYECMLLGLSSAVPPDPAESQNFYSSRGKTHQWYIDQPKPATPAEAEVDSLLSLVCAKGTYAQRKKWSDRMQELFTDQAFCIYLPSPKAFTVVRNKFGNLQPTLLRHRTAWNSQAVFLTK